MPMRETIALIPHCDTFIFIESLFAHIAAALKKPGIVVFQNTKPDFFGYETAYNIWNTGGCEIWPCNRPVGALLDMLPGYKNPKTRERLLWECPDQKCARMNPGELEAVFLESVNGSNKKFSTLQEAQNAEPSKKPTPQDKKKEKSNAQNRKKPNSKRSKKTSSRNKTTNRQRKKQVRSGVSKPES
jgi:hypothetical protein